MRRAALAFVLAAGLLTPCRGVQPPVAPAGDRAGPSDLVKVAGALSASVVRVEYTLRYDKGDAPSGSGAWMPWYGARDDDGLDQDWEQLIKDERPAERGGYILSPDRIVTSDPMLHPRFIREIAVRFGEQVVKATPAAYGASQNCIVLELALPLKDCKPLSFDGAAPGPYLTASYRPHDDAWNIDVGNLSSSVSIGAAGGKITLPSAGALAVNRAGTPVGMSMNGEIPADDSWKGSPEKWSFVPQADMARALADLQKNTSLAVMRVAIRFRSPRSTGARNPYREYEAQGQGTNTMTEWNGNGLLIDDRTVVVLANFKPTVTARLSDIKVYAADSAATGIPAVFAGTLADYGCFVAKLDTPAQGPLKMDSTPITQRKGELLLKSEISVLGETRTAYHWRERIRGYTLGWRRQVSPAVVSSSAPTYSAYGQESGSAKDQFLFTMNGSLVAATIARREKVSVQERQGWDYDEESGMVAVSYLMEAVNAGAGRIDSENRPLSEDEENRLAWLGVELQAMDPDLARVNNVVDQTSGGAKGAMVTYVYADSPAAATGIQVGDILLRMHVQGQPKPLDVQLDGMQGYEGMMERMWEMYDQMPEEYFDRLPQPWGSAENSLTRALTDIGFGTPYSAEIFRDGAVITRDLAVAQSPAHFDSAKRFKSESAGVTVRDLTYEVRRYFQLKPEDNGVIISKVEKGSKAAVAGLKPYEIILSVNDKPMASSSDFEEAIKAGGEFRLSVKRMTVGRIVKMKIDPASPKGGAASDERAEPSGEGDK